MYDRFALGIGMHSLQNVKEKHKKKKWNEVYIILLGDEKKIKYHHDMYK